MAPLGTKVVVALLVTGSVLGAQEKQTPPPPAAPRPFTLPKTQEITLANGMKVTLVPYGTLPLVTASVIIRTGAIDEGPDQVWLAGLMGDMLQQGTTTRSSAAVSDAVAGMGGDLSVSDGNDDMAVSGTVLGDSAAAFVRLLADVVRHPRFPDSEMARLIGDRQRQLAIALTQPQRIAAERYDKLLYPDHPYGRVYPTSQMLGAYTTAQVRDFYTRNVGAARAHLIVVGKFDESAVQQAANAAFTDWTAGQPPTVNIPKPRAERTLALIDRPGAVQSTLAVGLPVADPSSADWISMQVTNALLGGSFNSRITSDIRERKGYTYSPSSVLDADYHVATWHENADVTTSATGASLKEIFGEIDRLRDTAPSAAEVQGIQNYLAGVWVLRASTQIGLMGQLEFADLQGLDHDWLSNYIPRVHQVTPADVQSMAQKYLDPSKMAIVVAGDKKVIAEQLAPYGTPVQ
ncbi:MAG TPA: pitrilysin family protein [Gemmatimonadaceae bacterium]|nr:pitrilysin family protein [Gemmatimonadaceae bacterium]